MNIFLTLILIALVVTLFNISSQRKKAGRKPPHRAADAGKLHKEKSPAQSHAKIQGGESQRKAFLESYPVLKEVAETRDITFEAFEEQRIVKELLKELSSTSKDSEEWTAKMSVLRENVEHHVEEEEGEMFKKARKVLTNEEAEELGARMEAAKKKLSATAG